MIQIISYKHISFRCQMHLEQISFNCYFLEQSSKREDFGFQTWMEKHSQSSGLTEKIISFRWWVKSTDIKIKYVLDIYGQIIPRCTRAWKYREEGRVCFQTFWARGSMKVKVFVISCRFSNKFVENYPMFPSDLRPCVNLWVKSTI